MDLVLETVVSLAVIMDLVLETVASLVAIMVLVLETVAFSVVTMDFLSAVNAMVLVLPVIHLAFSQPLVQNLALVLLLVKEYNRKKELLYEVE
jgi:hypothetical protein